MKRYAIRYRRNAQSQVVHISIGYFAGCDIRWIEKYDDKYTAKTREFIDHYSSHQSLARAFYSLMQQTVDTLANSSRAINAE